MGYSTRQVSVGTTATRLDSGSDNRTIKIKGAADIFVGGDDVTASNGYKLASGTEMTERLEKDYGLYAIVATGTAAVSVLQKS